MSGGHPCPAVLRRRDWLILAALLPVTRAQAVVEPPAPGERVRWPAVTLLDGGAWDPPAPGGDASVVVFFTTTCPYCARHNARLQTLWERTRGEPLRVLGVAQRERVEHVRTYRARRHLGFPLTMDDRALQPALSTLRGVPLTCVVDRDQRLREVIRGEMAESDVLDLARWARR